MRPDELPEGTVTSFEVGGQKYDRVVALWFASGPGVDWLAVLGRIPPAGRLVLLYRFRYHASPRPYDPKDRTSWYRVAFKDDETDEHAIGICDTAADNVVTNGLRMQDRLLIHGDNAKLSAWLRSSGNAHARPDGKGGGHG